ncbi:MAG: winged helix-turn-helix domain-containing protein [Patescibacteria group bacterium]
MVAIEKKKVPTPVLLARIPEGEFTNDRLEALLDLGFDWYVIGTPSASLVEKICARITKSTVVESCRYGRLKLQGQMFYRDEKSVKLTDKESRLLRTLFEAKGEPVPRAHLMRVHGYKIDANTHTIESHLTRLRKKFRLLGFGEEVISHASKEGYNLKV